MLRATLLVLQGIDQGSRFELTESPMAIGRGGDTHIRLLDTEVSRSHVVFSWENDQWVVRDDASANGTFVNGKLISEQVLSRGDQIQVGRTVLLFTSSDEAPPPSQIEERISLIGEETADARSNIVGQVAKAAGEALASEAASVLIAPGSKAANLEVLYRIAEEAVRPSLPIDELLQRVLDLTIEAVGADRACMLVADSRTDRITPQVFSHRPEVDIGRRMPVSTTIVEYVLAQGHGVHTSDAGHDDRFKPGQSIMQSGIREAMCVPMHGRYELMGVIYVDTTTPPHALLPGQTEHRFNEELLTLLIAIGRQSALAIENNRYQQALVAAERFAAVGQTITSLSHHIKNILQGFRGGTYLIKMGLDGDDNQLVHKGWNIVEKNQNRIYHLVMDMLTFSKERQPKLEAGDINQTVAEICELLQGVAEEHEVALDMHLAENLPPIRFDAEGMHRAILNIVSNAIDAVEGIEGARVTVSTGIDSIDTDGESPSAFVEVSDNGAGVAEEEREAIFEPFESGKGARGTGLGLAVSRKILREHDGDITVTNAPQQGACFRLSWPVDASSQ